MCLLLSHNPGSETLSRIANTRFVEAAFRSETESLLIWLVLGLLFVAGGLLFGITKILERENQRRTAALEETEQRYRMLVELSPNSIFVHRDGIIIFANNTAAKLLKASSPEEIIGKSIYDIVHPEYHDFVAERIKQEVEGKPAPFAEEKFICMDGSVIDVEVTSAPIPYAGGKIASVGIVRDVSEKKKAEEAIRAREASYQGLFNSVLEAIYIQDKEGRFLDVNKGATRMYGYPREYFIGKTPEDLAAPGKNDLEALQKSFQKALQGIPQKFEFWGRRSNGEIFPKKVRLYQGTYFGQEVVIALANDITKEKETQKALQRQIQELHVLKATAMAGTEAASEEELLARVTQIVGETLYPDSFEILILNKDKGTLRTHSYNTETPEKISIHEGITGFVARTGKPRRVGDVSRDEYYLPASEGIRSELCVPMKIGQRVIGVVNAESRLPNFFNEEDERLLTTIAGQTATAIEKLRLLQMEKERRIIAENMRRSAEAMLSSLDITQVLESILTSLKGVVPYDSASIFLEEKDHLRLVHSRGLKNPESLLQYHFPCDGELFKEIYYRKSPYILSDAQQDSRFQGWGDTKEVHGWMGVPLIVRGNVIGIITLNSKQPDAYNEEHASLAMSFAHQATAAIENARLYQEALRESERRATLYEVSQNVVHEIQNPKETYRAIHQAVKRLMDCDAFIIVLKDPKTGKHQGVYITEAGKIFKTASLPENQGFAARVINEKQSIIFQDIHKNGEGEEIISLTSPQEIRSAVGVPMKIGEKVIGMISAQSYQPNTYGEEEKRLLEMLASYAAASVENARLLSETRQQATIFSELYQNTLDLSGEHNLKKLLDTTIRRARMLLNVSYGGLYIYRPEQQELELVVSHWNSYSHTSPPIGLRLQLGEGMAGKVAQTRKPLVIEDYRTWEGRSPQYEHIPFTSVLEVPMLYADQLIGVLAVNEFAPVIRKFTKEDEQLLSLFAAQAAGAVYSAQLFEETRRRLKTLEAVNKASTALREAKTMEEMLPILLDETLKAINTHVGSIWLHDSPNGELYQAVASGWATQTTPKRHKDTEGLIGHVFQSGEIYVAKDCQTNPLVLPSSRKYKIYRNKKDWTGISVPIRTSQEIIGVLSVAIPKGSFFGKDELKTLTTIAEMGGNAIHRASLHERTEQQIKRLVALRKIDVAIASSFDINLTLQLLTIQAIEQLHANAADILRFDPKLQLLTFAAGEGFLTQRFRESRLRAGTGLAGKAILERRVYQSKAPASDTNCQRRQWFKEEGFVEYYCMPLVAKGKVVGALEIFSRSHIDATPDWLDFFQTLGGQAAIAIDNSHLFSDLQRSNQELAITYDITLEGWGRALELRDKETEGHTRRVTELTVQLARRLGIEGNALVQLRRGALLHDIGKMGIPDEVLRKREPLTEEEKAIMRQHPQFAYELLSPIPYLRPALEIPYCHHEKWDGSGYPRGLKGEEIPLSARIFAIIDVWDALLSDRPYRKAWEKEKVIAYIRKESGKHFDPRIVSVFLEMVENGEI